MEYCNYWSGIITNDARCTYEIKPRISMAKATFNTKKTLFTSKLELNARKKLVKCYIWSIALYGAETWILGKIDNTWKILKCGAGEGWRRSVGPIVWEMKYYIVKKRGMCY